MNAPADTVYLPSKSRLALPSTCALPVTPSSPRCFRAQDTWSGPGSLASCFSWQRTTRPVSLRAFCISDRWPCLLWHLQPRQGSRFGPSIQRHARMSGRLRISTPAGSHWIAHCLRFPSARFDPCLTPASRCGFVLPLLYNMVPILPEPVLLVNLLGVSHLRCRTPLHYPAASSAAILPC